MSEQVSYYTGPLFQLGEVDFTHAAAEAAKTAEDAAHMIIRHAHGDFGNLSAADYAANIDGMAEDSGRLLSVYKWDDGPRFYVITEADRSVTNVMLAEEY